MKRIIATLCLILCFPIIALAADDDIRRPKSGMSLGMNPSLSGGGFAYLLRDDFSIAVASGGFSGSALNAVPGPGTRTVTDASSLLSIASGFMAIAPGNPAANTPAFGLNNIITRTVGRMYITARKQSNISDIVWCGWATAVGNRPDDGGFGYNSSLFMVREGSTLQVGPAPTADALYDIAIINKANGNYYMIKGGTQFPSWQLISIFGTASNANLYAVCRNAQSPIIGTISTDFIRIPNYLWTPKPISADSFGGTWPTTDGGGLTGIEAGGSDKTWTPSATWSISSGAAVNAPVAGTEKVTDGDMEAAGVANWADFNTPTTKEKNAVTPLAGTQDLHVIGDAAADGAQQTITGLTAQSWYRVSAMARTASGAVTIRTTSLTVGDSYPFSNYSGSATTKAGTFRVGTDVDGAIQSYCQGGAAEYYVDNISLKSLTLNQLITSINHTSTPDCYMSVKPTIATNFQAGIAFNIDDPNNPANFNLVYYNQNDGKIYWDKCVNGTYTNVFATTTTYSAGKALVVRKIGTSVYVWYNDAYVNSGTAAVTTGNYHGMFQTGSGATETKLDDWFCYGSGTNGEYSILNAFIN